MNRYINELGEPHLHLAGLKLWVHGYQYTDGDDYWDGNWLNATAICADNGATVMIRGAFIRTNEIYDWQHAVEKLLADQSYLQPLSSQCARLLNHFPIRGT